MEADYEKFLGIVFAVLLTVIAWVSSKLHGRVDSLEREKADLSDLGLLRNELKGHRAESLETMTELRHDIKSINTHLIEISRSLK